MVKGARMERWRFALGLDSWLGGIRPLSAWGLLLLLMMGSGCQRVAGEGAERVFITVGSAPIGGVFNLVGGAVADVLSDHGGEWGWRVQSSATSGSQENIRRLVAGRMELAVSNSSITYFAVRGESGWDQAHDVRAIATMAPNVGTLITRADSGIRTMPDLRGKRVYVGPAGAGFEMFLQPLFAAHGLDYQRDGTGDFQPLNGTQSAAVEMLSDGTADAAFLGGAIPTGAIQQACSSMEIHFIPLDSTARDSLVAEYPFFHPIEVPRETYPGMTEDYGTLNVGSMHLITAGNLAEELAYQLTKTIWEYRSEIAEKHPAGRAINEKNGVRNTGTPFHPGAIRFYQEIGIWPESGPAAEQASAASSLDGEAAVAVAL